LEIYQTFGRVVSALCEVFSWCVPRPALMVTVYPLLLLAAAATPKFTENGTYRLLVATRSGLKVTVN
jgi:hypothetical protein